MAKIQIDIPVKPEEIREISNAELEKQIQSARVRLYHLRYKMHVEEVENPNLKSVLRRNIARMITIQHEREMQAAGTVAGES